MQAIVSGLLIGYDELGSAEQTVLILHGWGANRMSTSGLAKTISSKFRVLVPDMPGFGESTKPDSIWGLDEYADFVQEFITKVGAGKIHAVVGHSNGGAIAIKLAAKGYAMDKLVLLGAAGIRSRDKGKKFVYRAVAKTGKTATLLLPKTVQKKIRSKWYAHIGSELYHAPGMEKIFKKVTSEDLVVDAAMVSVPTLLVYGSDDQATPPLYGRIYHEAIEGSVLDIVEGAGHYSFVDKPELVEPLVLDFLK
jgi:pimeloyl-ACP methyl ester carboxylesterase